MFIFRRYRKILAVVLAVSMIMAPMGVYADNVEQIPEEYTEAGEEAGVASALEEEAAQLEGLTAGEDYADGEGVFMADTLEKAEEVARSYHAELIDYAYGIATVRFPGSTSEALSDAAGLMSAGNADIDTLIEPNYYAELCDLDDYGLTELDTAEIVDDAAGEEAEISSMESDGECAETCAADPFTDKDSTSYQYYHSLIKDKEAHAITTGKGVTIAVLDSGVNLEHEDLKGRVIAKYIEASSNGRNLYDGKDVLGHGTHVCGIIAASCNNGFGGYGIAPNATVISIQITNQNSFPLVNISKGILMAIQMNVDVINMSVGGSIIPVPEYLTNAIDAAYDKGIICVAAAGNGTRDGSDYQCSSDEFYPAAADHCIAVGACGKEEGVLGNYSKYGDWVDIVAPGTGIWSTYIWGHGGDVPKYAKAGTEYIGTTSSNVYYMMKGTSQATPMVSSICALCLSANPDFKKNKGRDMVDIINSILVMTSDQKTYTYKDRSLFGMVQADAAVKLARDYKVNSPHTLVDAAGHHGSIMSGYICRKKSIKLRIGDAAGKVSNKKLTKKAVWKSSAPDKVSVKKGKVKCKSGAKEGDRVMITAEIGGDTLYYYIKVHRKVKKFGYLRGDGKVVKKYDIRKSVGSELNISNPYGILSDDHVGVYYISKKKKLADNRDGNWLLADGRFTYDIFISKKDRSKYDVLRADENGDPLKIKPIRHNTSIMVTYKLLDGSRKKFKVKIRLV